MAVKPSGCGFDQPDQQDKQIDSPAQHDDEEDTAEGYGHRGIRIHDVSGLNEGAKAAQTPKLSPWRSLRASILIGVGD